MLIRTEKLASRTRNRPIKDYAGARFGRLVAVLLVERDGRQNNHLWSFRCDCGMVVAKRIKNVRSGHTTSCGCAFSEMMAGRNATHGLSRAHPREYRSWKDMRARCSNPNDTDYAAYGGRGIKVCERWDDFGAFFADMGERPNGTTLDRVDVNGDYEPGNCRWADHVTQANNKRSNRRIDGRTLQQWSDENGMDRSKVRYRLNVGYSLDEALQPGDLRRGKKSRNSHG